MRGGDRRTPDPLEYLEALSSYGLKEFILCLGYKSYMIEDYFLNCEVYSADLTVRLGSLEAVKYYQCYLEERDSGSPVPICVSVRGGSLAEPREMIPLYPVLVPAGLLTLFRDRIAISPRPLAAVKEDASS